MEGLSLKGCDPVARFQLNRLEFALTRSTSPIGEAHRRLIDRCILSLYEDCIEAAVGEDARRMIERFRSTGRRVRPG